MNKHVLRAVLFLFSLTILGGLIWYSNPSRLFSILQTADIPIIALGLVFSTGAILLRVLKWYTLLGTVPFLTLLPIQILGLTISNFTPVKIGEPGKTLILKAVTGIPVGISLPSIIWERILDVTVLIIFSLTVFSILPNNFLALGIIGVGFFITLIFILGVILNSQRVGRRVFSFLQRLPVLNKLSAQFVDSFYSSKITRKKRSLALVLTFFAWLCDGLAFYLAFQAIGINTDLFLLLGLICFSTIIGVVSALPGGIGSVEISLAALLGFIGISSDFAVTGVIIARFITLWFSIILGGLALVYLSRKIDLKNIL